MVAEVAPKFTLALHVEHRRLSPRDGGPNGCNALVLRIAFVRDDELSFEVCRRYLEVIS